MPEYYTLCSTTHLSRLIAAITSNGTVSYDQLLAGLKRLEWNRVEIPTGFERLDEKYQNKNWPLTGRWSDYQDDETIPLDERPIQRVGDDPNIRAVEKVNKQEIKAAAVLAKVPRVAQNIGTAKRKKRKPGAKVVKKKIVVSPREA